MTIKNISSYMLLCAGALFSTCSNAVVVEWVLNNAIFNDGGEATGSFKVDYGDNTGDFNIGGTNIINVNLQLTAGSIVTSTTDYNSYSEFSTVGAFTGSPGFKLSDITFMGTDPNAINPNTLLRSNWFNIGFNEPWLPAENLNVPIDLTGYVSFSSVILTPLAGQSLQDDRDRLFINDDTTTIYERYLVSGSVSGAIVSTVPVPAAVWLFASGLVGLIGLAKREVRV